MTDTPNITSASLGDASIEYLDYGGTGPALVMLHATGFLPWLWHPIARELRASYRVIAPFFCDHRTAEPETGGLRWSILADDLVRFCEALALDRPLLAGHSMGATVMTLAAARRVDLARGMVLIEPIFLPSELYRMNMSVDQHPLAAKAIRRRMVWSDLVEAREYLQSKNLFSRFDPEMLELYLRFGLVSGDTGGLTLVCTPRREASLFMGSVHEDPWPLLPAITTPTLVVEGGRSENKAFIDLHRAASLLPRGAYRCVEEAGHLVPMEQPRETASLIKEYFDTL